MKKNTYFFLFNLLIILAKQQKYNQKIKKNSSIQCNAYATLTNTNKILSKVYKNSRVREIHFITRRTVDRITYKPCRYR